jgi:hypothetical protein
MLRWANAVIQLLIMLVVYKVVKPDRNSIIRALIAGTFFTVLDVAVEAYAYVIGLWYCDITSFMVYNFAVESVFIFFFTGMTISWLSDLELFKGRRTAFLLLPVVAALGTAIDFISGLLGYIVFLPSWTAFHHFVLWLMMMGSTILLYRKIPIR